MFMPYEIKEVLTGELLYTGITSAREGVEVWGSANVI
jgi:ATP-dependent exoDNAse (exonuclease V) alpha subunit